MSTFDEAALDADLEERKKGGGKRVIAVDFDETITAQPKLFKYLTKALDAAGAKIVIVTGNMSPRDVLKQLLDGWEITYSDIIQYDDSDRTGLARAAVLKKIGAYFAIDDRIARGPVLADACPHLFIMVSADDNQDTKKGANKDATQAAKQAVKGQRMVTLKGGPLDGQTHETRGLTDLIEITSTDAGRVTYRLSTTEPVAEYEDTNAHR